MMSDQKVALITGGMGGIGVYIARKLADEGNQVIVTYNSGGPNSERAQHWLAEQEAQGYRFNALFCNVSDFNSCKEMIDDIISRYGRIDILVNNAGITRDAQLKKMTQDAWQTVMQTNLDSVFNMTRNVINTMIDHGYGRIINISSINGQKGQFGQANYSAAKAGMHGFTKAVAQEVARKGITVNTISPGYIGTDMVMAIREDIREQIIAGIPVGRLGKPEEIAKAVAYLACEEAGFITGSNLAINGGQHMC
ncbi:acetoacetyl-CoA reductase [Piscirickettsia salmonis]